MKFKLIDNGDSVRKHDKDILKANILGMKHDEGNFIILEPKEPIENSIYMQVSINNGEYLVETRLLFGSETDYKHYSKIYSSIDDVERIFSNYYIKLQLPDLKLWKDETSDTDNSDDNNMVKLYKKKNDAIYYFEIWANEDNSITIHKGRLGEIGNIENILGCNYDQALSFEILQISQKYRVEGYDDYANLIELIIQYPIKEGQISPDIQQVEDNLNNCLGWTGNGHCESCDLFDGIATLYCYVIDKDIAVETIVDSLEEETILSDNLKIAYADENSGEYKLLYPNEGTFII